MMMLRRFVAVSGQIYFMYALSTHLNDPLIYGAIMYVLCFAGSILSGLFLVGFGVTR